MTRFADDGRRDLGEATRNVERTTSTSTTSTPGQRKSKELGGEADEALPYRAWAGSHCEDNEGNQFGLWQTDPNAPGA